VLVINNLLCALTVCIEATGIAPRGRVIIINVHSGDKSHKALTVCIEATGIAPRGRVIIINVHSGDKSQEEVLGTKCPRAKVLAWSGCLMHLVHLTIHHSKHSLPLQTQNTLVPQIFPTIDSLLPDCPAHRTSTFTDSVGLLF